MKSVLLLRQLFCFHSFSFAKRLLWLLLLPQEFCFKNEAEELFSYLGFLGAARTNWYYLFPSHFAIFFSSITMRTFCTDLLLIWGLLNKTYPTDITIIVNFKKN